MDPTAQLVLMDLNMQEMYREITRATPGGWVVERSGLVMCGSPHGTIVTNMAMVTRPLDAQTVRSETDRAFRRAALPFSVWTRAHADDELEAELAAVGFHEVMNTPGMALDRTAAAPAAPPAEIDIRAVTDDAGRADYAHVMAEAYAVYGSPKESTRAHFASLDSIRGPTTQAFLAYRDGQAVAGAILYMTHGIGGVGWVGTLPEAFGRGYGTAITWRVVVEGFERGARFMNLQASPMGAPVYRRMGFSTPTFYRMLVALD